LGDFAQRAVLQAGSRKKEPFFGTKGRIAGNRGEKLEKQRAENARVFIYTISPYFVFAFTIQRRKNPLK